MVCELNSLDIIRNAYKNHYPKDISEEKMYFHIYIYCSNSHWKRWKRIFFSKKANNFFFAPPTHLWSCSLLHENSAPSYILLGLTSGRVKEEKWHICLNNGGPSRRSPTKFAILWGIEIASGTFPSRAIGCMRGPENFQERSNYTFA